MKEELISIQEDLFRAALSYTRNRDDALDLLQDTYEAMIIKADQYQDRGTFRQWGMSIMHNLFIDLCRKKTRSIQMVNYPADLSVCEDPKVTIPNLHTAIGRLDHKNQRRIMYMRLYGYKYREIAERLQLDLNAVRSNIYYAKNKLRKLKLVS